MKKIFLMIFMLLLTFSVCEAEALFDVSENNIDGCIYREAYVMEHFNEANIGISIGKVGAFMSPEKPAIYMYEIAIFQPLPATFNARELTIMSEVNSVTIPEGDFKRKGRQIGMYMAQDHIACSDDPGRINIVIDSIISEMIIRIKTTDNKIYTLYPSTEFIDGLKKVADWS